MALESAGNLLDDGSNAHTAPYSEGIERTCVGIVALTRLTRCLVEVDDDGKTGHEEEEEHHPKLADAFLSLAQRLPEESDETKQQRQTIEDVVTLVVLKFVGKQLLVAQTPVVKPVESSNPVAVLEFAVALKVVLATGEVPHEVAPVHEVALIGQEEANVLQLCRHLYRDHLATTVVWHFIAIYTAHPTLVGHDMLRS